MEPVGRAGARMLLVAGLVLAVGLGAVPAAADEEPDLEADRDRDWISLTGDVVEASVERFVLDYGEGLITVEMDDWDWYDEADHILPGDRVTVYGRIDDDFYEKRTIEADSAYVYDRSTYYYASDADEEDVPFYSAIAVPEGSWMTVTGTIEKVDGREFVLDTGTSKLRVDTILMPYETKRTRMDR